MDFIFMLTRNDATVADALAIVRRIRPLGLRHIGFKDVGAEPETLRALASAIREGGASPWMEIVSTDRARELSAIRLGREIGLEAILGGVCAAEGRALLATSAIRYMPFVGRPQGHPTELAGSPEEVERHCDDLVRDGCAGVDLLAYRAREADPLALIAGARRGLGASAKLVVAGSINSAARIAAIRAAGADAFTIGAAALDGVYAAGAGPLEAQLQAILRDCEASAPLRAQPEQ